MLHNLWTSSHWFNKWLVIYSMYHRVVLAYHSWLLHWLSSHIRGFPGITIPPILSKTERTRLCVALHLVSSLIVRHSSSSLTLKTNSSLLSMAKLKNKSSILRSVQGDFRLQASRQASTTRIPRAQIRSQSPVQSDPDSPSQASPTRTRVVFADFATLSSGARVSSKMRNKTMHKTRSSAPSSPLPTPSDNKAASSGGSRVGAPTSSEGKLWAGWV